MFSLDSHCMLCELTYCTAHCAAHDGAHDGTCCIAHRSHLLPLLLSAPLHYSLLPKNATVTLFNPEHQLPKQTSRLSNSAGYKRLLPACQHESSAYNTTAEERTCKCVLPRRKIGSQGWVGCIIDTSAPRTCQAVARPHA